MILSFLIFLFISLFTRKNFAFYSLIDSDHQIPNHNKIKPYEETKKSTTVSHKVKI